MFDFFLVWKHPCLSSLFALGFFPLLSLLETHILQFSGCGWHLPEGLHRAISTPGHWGTSFCKALCISAHLKGHSDHISPVKNPEHHFSILMTQLKCPSHLHQVRQENSGPQGAQSPNFISFSLQSHDFFFFVELLLVALRYMACQICLNDFLVPIITRTKLTGSAQSIKIEMGGSWEETAAFNEAVKNQEMIDTKQVNNKWQQWPEHLITLSP